MKNTLAIAAAIAVGFLANTALDHVNTLDDATQKRIAHLEALSKAQARVNLALVMELRKINASYY